MIGYPVWEVYVGLMSLGAEGLEFLVWGVWNVDEVKMVVLGD